MQFLISLGLAGIGLIVLMFMGLGVMAIIGYTISLFPQKTPKESKQARLLRVLSEARETKEEKRLRYASSE